MKSFVLALALAFTAASLAPTAAEARRIGGGGSSGMQRSLPRTAPATTPTAPPAAAPIKPAAAPTTAPGVAAAAAPRRSWMGPIAGLAAGLGIAALMSHFGLGEGMGNIFTMLLIAGLAFFAIRFLMRRFAPAMSQGPSFANAGGANGGASAAPAGTLAGSPALPLASQPAVSSLPPGFDAPAFERTAKLIFIRMQAANDTGDLNDLRAFTTPEMFASVKLDLQDRRSAPQTTDVVQVDAQVLEVVDEGPQQVVSVRFHGLIREDANGPTEPFDEAWHLVKPNDGSREWAIAGIQQVA